MASFSFSFYLSRGGSFKKKDFKKKTKENTLSTKKEVRNHDHAINQEKKLYDLHFFFYKFSPLVEVEEGIGDEDDITGEKKAKG